VPSLPRPRLRRAARVRGVAEAAQGPAEPRVEFVEHDDLRWINIERPGPVEQAWLEEHFEFHPLDYEDIRSKNQRPKIDEYPDYLFIVLNFPVFDKAVGWLNSGELDVFVGRDFVITIPNVPLQPVEYLYERCRSSEPFRQDLLSNYKEVVEALEDTNESAISHRLNDVLLVLTSVSIVFLPLTLIASIWGMNVHVPGQGSSTAFWLIIGAMAALFAGMIWLFRR